MMGVREILWLLVALLLAYAAMQFFRALGAARDAQPAQAAPSRKPAEAAPEAAAPGVLEVGEARTGTREDGVDEKTGGATDEVPVEDFDYASVLRPLAAPAPEVSQLELEAGQLRRELVSLQTTVDAQRHQIGDLEGEVRRLREQLERAEAAQTSSSPEYSEALALARHGMGADVIAARCGITVAEAELILSIAGGRGG
jgi:HAMP domain-containing protein